MKLHKITDKIWTIDNFLSIKECEDLILFSEHKGYDEADVSLATGAKIMKNVRNNERLIYEDSNFRDKIWLKLASFIPTRVGNMRIGGLNERFRFYKYDTGQKFKRHIDGRFKRNEEEESRITFLVYLNDNFTGGKTKFDDLTIHPVQGKALCFIHEQKHESTPIQDGVKYVLRSDIMYKKLKNETKP
ncbi:2OG-Fe(II) oxygenase [Aquimarina aquimarini]|uniref:2OG-Fe(II) oxygenase n=1 Tax=Aquimarina aquimarini TaxID=1191734 RepID=UPI000D54AECA|nr:2OG-Fe(II) oxygenase [Aquimarina aquimarini]